MAKIKKAQDELNVVLMDLYLVGIKSDKQSDKMVVPFISGQHPCEIFLEMTERIRRAIDYLSK